MTTFDRQAVLDALSRLVTPGIKLTALADELGARKHEYTALHALLEELVEEGVARILSGGAYALAPAGRPADPHAKPKRAPKQPRVEIPRGKPMRRTPTAPRKAALPWKIPEPRTIYDPETGEEHERLPPEAGTDVTVAGRTVTGPVPTTVARAPSGPVRTRRETSPPPARRKPSATPPPAPVATDNRVIGRITVHPAGYGFVATDAGETVFVPAKYRGTSLDGDRVSVETWPGVRGTEGRVADVLARGRARLTGILHRVSRAV